jgi:hypothetical protein
MKPSRTVAELQAAAANLDAAIATNLRKLGHGS